MRFSVAALLGVTLALAPMMGQAQESAASQIISQAKYWEQKGRYDIARQSWLKLLRSDPENTDALAGLAIAEVRTGRPEVAQQYLASLRRVAPGHPAIEQIESGVELVADGEPADLSTARALARAGRYDESVVEYQRVFGGGKPHKTVALEYWQTVGGAEGGWLTAKEGLEQLVKDFPGNPDYRLALATHLTYREETRRAGVRQLMELGERDDARQPVQPKLRQALLWMGGSPSDVRLYQAYLRKYGDDTQVSTKLASARNQGAKARRAAQPTPPRPSKPVVDKRGIAIRKAWDLFDEGRIAESEREFTELLRKNSRDPEAIGGIGVIRLREDRFSESRSLLEQASRHSRSQRRKWAPALEAATFWEQVRLAEADNYAGRFALAERRLRDALSRSPNIAAEEPSIRVTLADIVLAQRRPLEAENLYRRALQNNPEDEAAASGLVTALASRGRVSEALELYRGFTPGQRDRIGSVVYLQTLALRQQAHDATKIGDYTAAEHLLVRAVSLNPEATWPRMDLARMYLRQSRREEARSLIDGLPTSGPKRGEAAYIRGILASEDQNWFDGLMWMEQIPVIERNRSMARLQQRMWVRYQTERAAVLARQGDDREAVAILSTLEPYANEPDLIGSIAFSYAEAGLEGRGLALLRHALARETEPGPDLKLAYAGLLLRLGQQTEFDQVVNELAAGPKLTARQEGTLVEMRITQRLRQADEVRQLGNLARAYDLLEPALRANPNDARLVLALARLYDQAGEYKRSGSLYRYLIELNRGNLDAYHGMIQASLEAGLENDVDFWLEKAFEIAPDSGRLHALAGRVAKARGEDRQALEHFRLALKYGPESDGIGGRGRLRLQTVDEDLRPIGSPNSREAKPYPTHLHGDRSVLPHRLGERQGFKFVKVAGVRLTSEGRLSSGAGSRLPPLLPPGYEDSRVIPERRLPATPPARREQRAPVTQRAPRAPEPLPADTRRTFVLPPNGPDAIDLRMDPLLRSRDYIYETEPVPATATEAVLQEIEDIAAKRTAKGSVGTYLRNRSGVNGLDKLENIEVPAEVSYSGYRGGQVSFRAVPSFADAGAVSGQDLLRFGTMAFIDTTEQSFLQNETGVAFALAYDIKSFHIDAGVSPVGFEVENFVGGVAWNPKFEELTLGFNFSRRSVDDSLLSYAGTRDPRTGVAWGGVTKTGLRVDAALDLGESAGIYAVGGYHVLNGENVADNNEVEAGGGAFMRLLSTPLHTINIGLNITTLFYDKNLRFFSFGHGGYFSPQRYFSLAMPVEWYGGHNRFSWRLYGSVALQSFREEGSALYPNNQFLQDALVEFADDFEEENEEEGLTLQLGYGGQNSTGAGVAFGAALEYLISPHVAVGAMAGFDNAKDYDESKVGIYLRWTTKPTPAVSVPPLLTVPNYDYGKRLP